MDANMLRRHFARMGARVAVSISDGANVRLDVRSDRHGEYFDLRAGPLANLVVVDLRPSERHLLLLAHLLRNDRKDKFLCGHDERHWFVAAVPGDRGVSGVRTAIEALKPDFVRQAQARAGLRSDKAVRRRNSVFVRQGEWFFVPTPDLIVDESMIRQNEPLSRGRGSKPHMVEFLARSGGELVYVSHLAQQGLTEDERRALFAQDPSARKVQWVAMRRNPDVHVRGRITHPDHATVILSGWHRVNMNTEWRAPASRHVAFLD